MTLSFINFNKIQLSCGHNPMKLDNLSVSRIIFIVTTIDLLLYIYKYFAAIKFCLNND